MESMSNLEVKRISINRIEKGLREQVDKLNEEHYGTIFHETAFNHISSEFFETELSFFLAYLNGRLVGICPCHQIRDQLLVHLYSNLTSQDLPYGGWVYDSQAVDLRNLLKHMKLKHNEALHVSSNIELSSDSPYKPESIKHFSQAQTAIIKLAGSSEDELFNGFKHSQKNKIRKAEKLGVKIKQAKPAEIGDFHELLAELKENVNKAYSPMNYFQDVYSHYFGLGRAACLIAQYGGENISTLIILANKAYATIWMGGRKMGIPNNLYQNERMIWEAITWARSYGSAYFDLCVVDETRYPNLARMKLSFSRDLRPYYFYTIRKPAFKVLNRLQGLKRT